MKTAFARPAPLAALLTALTTVTGAVAAPPDPNDLAIFGQQGWELEALRAFDAFPMTHHVECVAVLRPRAESS